MTLSVEKCKCSHHSGSMYLDMAAGPGSLVRPWKARTLLMGADRVIELGPDETCLVLEGEYHGFSDRFYYRVLVGGVLGWLRDCDVEVVR